MGLRERTSGTAFLLQLLREGYEKKTWHGPNLRQSLRGVSAAAATWRPGQNRHNIWELAMHAAYWKYVVRRRLLGEQRGSFAIPGSNWFASPKTATEAAWRNCQQLLEDEQRRLIAAVAAPRHARAVQKHRKMLFGAAFHDVYHAGQIRLLRRLQESRSGH